MAKKIFINYTCPVRVPLVFSRFSLRGRDEMKLLISPEMMITMMQMILTRVRNVAVTGRQSRDGDMRPGLDNGRVFAGPSGPRRCGVISRVPRHDHRADSAFFAQIQTDIDTLACFTPRSTERE